MYSLCIFFTGIKYMVSSQEPLQKDQIGSIQRKLEQCRNQENNPDSDMLVYIFDWINIESTFLHAVDCGFKTRSGQTKDYKIGICCFSAKHATLRRKCKDWLTLNQDNVSKWGDMSICGLLFQWASIIKI
jgi:hypothetical protein